MYTNRLGNGRFESRHMKVTDEHPGRTGLRVAIIAAAVLLVTFGVLLFVFRDRIFVRGLKPDAARAVPTEEMLAAVEAGGFRPDLQRSRMTKIMIKDPETSPYILSWLLLPGQLNSMTPAQSAYIDVTDQALLMRLYIARGDRKSAKQLSDAIARDFSDDSGGLLGTRPIEEIEGLRGKAPTEAYAPELEPADRVTGTSLEAECAYLRALLEYTGRWGGVPEWERIQTLANVIYSPQSGFYNDHVVVPDTRSDWIVGLTDYEEFKKEMAVEPETFRAMKLCALDLRALEILANADASYEPMFEDALRIVREGQISEDVPLFALAYSEEGGDYVYSTGAEARVDAVSSLRTMLHLSEVGALPTASLSWIREQIFNLGYIYTQYDIINGIAASDVEATEAYGLILGIAVAEGDYDLYVRTLARVSRSLATLDTSPARNMIFRKASERRNMTTAADNLSLLLAMTA